MTRLATLAAAAALVTAFGLAGTAKAQTELLTNGDAEFGNLTGWVVDAGDPAAVADLNFIDAAPIGTRAFDMGPNGSTAVGPGGTASLAQEALVVSECNLEDLGLLGQWSLEGFFVTQEPADFGTVSVAFDTGPTFTTTDLKSPNDEAFEEVTDSGDIPAGAVTVDLTISGTEANGDNFSNVGWDDLSLTINCVDKTATISGKIFTSSKKKPIYTFRNGLVGQLESAGAVAEGSIIKIIYSKHLTDFSKNVNCVFDPKADSTSVVDVASGSAFLVNWQMTCSDDTTADADLRLVDKGPGLPRGAICVDADTADEFDIGDPAVNPTCNSNADAIKLDSGRVFVND